METTNDTISELYSTHSPLLRTFEVLGDGWTFLILREAFFGARKFKEYQKILAAPRSRLTERLGHLVKHEVLLKREYSSRPVRYEYILSDSGHDLYGMIMMMKNWGERWRPQDISLQLNHKKCNAILEPHLICSACRKNVALEDVRLSSNAPQLDQPNFGIRRQLKRDAFDQDKRNDPVARTLAVIGDQWTMMVLKEAFNDVVTFEEFQKNLDISRSTLSARLLHLVKQDVLSRTAYSEKPPRYSYQLTPAGRDLFSVALLMFHWGERWLFDDKNSSYHLVHQTCGNRLKPVVVCTACHDEVFSRDVDSLQFSEAAVLRKRDLA